MSGQDWGLRFRLELGGGNGFFKECIELQKKMQVDSKRLKDPLKIFY